MAELVGAIASTVVIALVLKVLLAALLGGLWEWRSWRYLTRLFRRPAPPVPTRRPLRQIAVDARRISERYHQEGMRFAQYEGRRQAFDRVLAEASDALGIDHLLLVLQPGPERDHERDRVEERLVDAGVLRHATPPA